MLPNTHSHAEAGTECPLVLLASDIHDFNDVIEVTALPRLVIMAGTFRCLELLYVIVNYAPELTTID